LSSPKKRVAWDLKAVTRVLMSLIFCNRCLSSAADCCVTLMMNSIDAMKDVDEPRELTIQSQRGENRQVWILSAIQEWGFHRSRRTRFFDAVFTTQTDGTGMGLRISRSIIESHGGRWWAADNSPRGARFCFTLSIRGEAATQLCRKSALDRQALRPTTRSLVWNHPGETKTIEWREIRMSLRLLGLVPRNALVYTDSISLD
jgi:hypothetical protein